MDAQTILEHSQLRPGRHMWWARVPFAVAAVGGGAILVVLKYAGLSQLIVTAAAIGFILAYAAVVWRVPILRLRDDQLADNCYYLGFLYTLFSLSWALWEFSQTQTVEQIIANFGLALGSTIVGILLRVTINQARKDILETESDARMALAESVVRLRVQIDEAVLALASFHKQSEQIARDAIQGASDRAAEALDESITKVGQSSTSVLERVDQAFAEFTANTKQLNTASSATVKALKSLLTRIESIEAPNDMVRRAFEPALHAMTTVTERIGERWEADQRLLDETNRQMGEIGAAIAATAAGLGDVNKSLADAAATSSNAARTMNEASDHFCKVAGSVREALDSQLPLVEKITRESSVHGDAARAQLESITLIFQQYNDALGTEIDRCRRMVSSTGSALADLADAINTRLEKRSNSAIEGPVAE